MKKVRVLKEMPFAKVGEEFELPPDGTWCIDNDCEGKKTWFGLEILKLIDNGWLEWVEEEKSLTRKIFEKFNSESINYRYKESLCATFAQIAREHYQEDFKKRLDSIQKHLEDLESTGDIQVRSKWSWKGFIDMHRKALEDA